MKRGIDESYKTQKPGIVCVICEKERLVNAFNHICDSCHDKRVIESGFTVG